MVSKKSNVIIVAIATLLSFFAAAYMSCKKPGDGLVRCNGVICQNSGYCMMDTVTKKPKCICPKGYEGSNCSVVSVAKFHGTWDVHQTTIGSDSLNYIGKDTAYLLFLTQSATPTTFFVNNFLNDANYNKLICTLDSMDSYRFLVDTLSPFQMAYGVYKIEAGAGSIAANGDSIIATMATRHKNATTNWQRDTLRFIMKPHKM